MPSLTQALLELAALFFGGCTVCVVLFGLLESGTWWSVLPTLVPVVLLTIALSVLAVRHGRPGWDRDRNGRVLAQILLILNALFFGGCAAAIALSGIEAGALLDIIDIVAPGFVIAIGSIVLAVRLGRPGHGGGGTGGSGGP